MANFNSPDDVDVRCLVHAGDRLLQFDLLGVIQRLRQQPFDQFRMFPDLFDAVFILITGGPGLEYGAVKICDMTVNRLWSRCCLSALMSSGLR